MQSESDQKCLINGVEKPNNISHPNHNQPQNTKSSSFQLTFQVPDSSDPSKMQTKILQIQKLSNGIPKNLLAICICAPNSQGKKVGVVPTDPLFILNPLFPGDQKVYFYNGDVLNSHCSFQDYGISNGDRIVTVPFEQMNLSTEIFWRNATRNSSNYKERSNGLHDEQTKFLNAKNNDLVLFKAESKPISNRRLMKNLMFLNDDQSSSFLKTDLSFFPSKRYQMILFLLCGKIFNVKNFFHLILRFINDGTVICDQILFNFSLDE